MSLSKKHLNQHLQKNRSAEIRQFIALNQQVFAELLTFIDFAEKFTLGFVEVNFIPDIDLLIEGLQINPECKNIQFCVINLSDENLRFLRDEIVKVLSKVQVEANKKLVLILRGLEKSIGVFENYPPVLQDLNFVRDAYKKVVPHPILLILPDYAITRVAKFAPDFWAWNSGIFRFKTPERTKEHALNQIRNIENIFNRSEPQDNLERIDLLERLLMEYKPTGCDVSEGNILRYSNILQQLGVVYLKQRMPEKARLHLEEAEKIAPKIGDSRFEAEVLNDLGRTYYQQRQFETAITYHQKSLNIAQNIKDSFLEAAALFYLGNAYLELRQFAKAEEFYQQCLEIYEQLNESYNCASTYHQLGNVAYQQRQFENALQYYLKALKIYEDALDLYNAASVYHNLGNVAFEQRQFEQARQYYLKALKIKKDVGNLYNAASDYHQLGMLAQQQQQFDEARQYYLKALKIFEDALDLYNAATVYHQLGIVAEEQKQFEQAQQYHFKALKIREDTGNFYSAAHSYHQLGMISEEQQQFEQAISYYQKAFGIYEKFQDWYWASSTLDKWGRLLEAQSKFSEALPIYIYALVIDINHNKDWISSDIDDLARMLRVLGENEFDAIWHEVMGEECLGELREAIWAARDRLDEEG